MNKAGALWMAYSATDPEPRSGASATSPGHDRGDASKFHYHRVKVTSRASQQTLNARRAFRVFGEARASLC